MVPGSLALLPSNGSRFVNEVPSLREGLVRMSNPATQRTAHIPPRKTEDDVLGLAEELSQLGRIGDLVTTYLEEHLGLTHRQLRILTRIAEHAAIDFSARERDLAGALVDRGLVSRGQDGYRVTEHGRVVLDQVEAIRIRLAAQLAAHLKPEGVGSLRSVVQQLISSIPPPMSPIA